MYLELIQFCNIVQEITKCCGVVLESHCTVYGKDKWKERTEVSVITSAVIKEL